MTTYAVFRLSARHLDSARARLVGFLFYWIVWCLLLPCLTVGPSGLRRMFAAPHLAFGKPAWLGIVLLVGPPCPCL